MNVTFVKRGHITIGEQRQGKNGFYYFLGAVVDRATETFSCSEEVFNKIQEIGEFQECDITFVFTDSFNNPRLGIADISKIDKK